MLFSGVNFAQTEVLDSLKTALKQTNKDTLKVIYGIEISRKLHHSAHDADKEYSYAEEAVDQALITKDTLLYARALDNLGLLYRYHQHYKEAMTYHIRAYELVEARAVEPLYKMIFANNTGVAARYNQEYDKAISYYLKALRLAEREGGLKDIAISSNGIGNSLLNIPNREEEALHYFEKSLESEKKRNNSLGIAMNYLSIGDCYTRFGDYTKAREYFDKLLALNKKRKDSFGIAITYEFMGSSFIDEGKELNTAAYYFKKSLHQFKEMGDAHKQAELLLKLGDVEWKKKQWVEAEYFYRKSLAKAKEINQFGLIKENSLKLSEIMEQYRKPDSALTYYKQGTAYGDSINLHRQQTEIEALSRQYDIQKSEDKIALLEKDKTIQKTELNSQKQKLKKRKTTLVLLGLAFVLLLLMFIMYYRDNFYRKKADEKLIKSEREKIKAIHQRDLARAEIKVTQLRVNPHFLFNSLNAISYLVQSKQNVQAKKYLVVFSRYTRMVLETSKKQVISLGEELKLARYYLILEQNRFEKDLEFDVSIDDQAQIDKVTIPPLLLQPFIENAIWHGLLPSKGLLKLLKIKVNARPNGLSIQIDDNGIGRKAAMKKNSFKRHGKKHKSMGLEIIKERVALYNRSEAANIHYEIIDKTDEHGASEGTRVVFELEQKIMEKTG